MRTKEVTSINSLNQYINMGWILVRGYEINGITRFLLMKDDSSHKDNKLCKNNNIK